MSFQKFIKATSFVLLALLSQVSFAQTKTVSGRITDSRDGSGISGVSVAPKGSRTGTQTGSDGSFTLTVNNAVNTLVISSVGFVTQEIDLDGRTNFDIS